MLEMIREYNMNGTIIIGVDNGYGNMKTARKCFKTAVTKYEGEPVLSRDYIKYGDAYYVIGEGRKGFVADKQSDDDNYVLTLAAIVKELEARGMTASFNHARIHLAVGLPLKWVQPQKEGFREYMLRNRTVEVGYKDSVYRIEFAGCTVMPQCYAAVAENLKDFSGMTMLADIGNGTMNLMYLNNGRVMESKAWTEKLGVFQCFQKMVQDKSRSIYYTEQKKKRLGMELKKCTGVFKGTRRKELQDEISGADRQIAHLKKERTSIVRENGFDSLEAFHQEYKAAKNAEAAYKKDLAKWEKVYGIKATDETTLAGRLEKYWRMDKEEQIPDREPVRKRSHDRDDR